MITPPFLGRRRRIASGEFRVTAVKPHFHASDQRRTELRDRHLGRHRQQETGADARRLVRNQIVLGEHGAVEPELRSKRERILLLAVSRQPNAFFRRERDIDAPQAAPPAVLPPKPQRGHACARIASEKLQPRTRQVGEDQDVGGATFFDVRLGELDLPLGGCRVVELI